MFAEKANNLVNLHTLNLGTNKISAAGLKSIADNALNFKNLNTLTLPNNQIGDLGLKALG